MSKKRESWGTKLGVILAVAGSAVGLGNFLRFPVQAAQNGGGAFMIPYIISFLLLGMPLMWIEWTAGRYGGGFGHGTAPGIFHTLWQKNRFIKYFGVIGIFGPVVIFMYYTFIESWLLGYMVYSLVPSFNALTGAEQLKGFLTWYTGSTIAYVFFLITFSLNLLVVFLGLRGGIEKFCNWALPVLFIAAVILVIRVLTLGAPHADRPDWTTLAGLQYLWTPDFTKLLDAKVWMAAAGQIFFTLSVGIGVILTYASYLKQNDDVVRSGFAAAMTNEFAEVVLGGCIVIPAAFAFFGPEKILEIAGSGAFNLGFITMPEIFHNIPWGAFFAFIWFLLLFLAGITSSVSLAQPPIAFLEDEFDLGKRDAVLIFGVVTFLLCQPAVLLMNYGVIDELDWWGGTFALVLFGTIEAILFSWVFGIDKAWDEIHKGASWRLPIVYRFIIKYVTPVALIAILGFYCWQNGYDMLMMKHVAKENMPIVLFMRIYLLTLFTILGSMVFLAWRKRKKDTMPPKSNRRAHHG